MDNLAQPNFSIGRVALATGVKAETIRTWFKTGKISLGATDLDVPQEGLGRMLSGRTAIAIGIAGALTGLYEIKTEIAVNAAIKFAHVGDEHRDPGFLFPTGSTFLVIGPHGSEIVRIGGDERFADVFAKYQRRQAQLPATIFFELDELVDRIRCNLGLGRDPLDAVSCEPAGYASKEKTKAKRRKMEMVRA